MLMEPQEREDAFFRYENNGMTHLGGYYLYYEKNPGMQTYMVDKNKELQPDVPEHYEDQAVKDFRKIITDKKEKKKELAAPSVFFIWIDGMPRNSGADSRHEFFTETIRERTGQGKKAQRFLL